MQVYDVLVGVCLCGCGRELSFIKTGVSRQARDLAVSVTVLERGVGVVGTIPAEVVRDLPAQLAVARNQGVGMVHQLLGVAHGVAGADVPALGDVHKVHAVANLAAALLAQHDALWWQELRSAAEPEVVALLDSMVFEARARFHATNPAAATAAGITPPVRPARAPGVVSVPQAQRYKASAREQVVGALRFFVIAAPFIVAVFILSARATTTSVTFYGNVASEVWKVPIVCGTQQHERSGEDLAKDALKAAGPLVVGQRSTAVSVNPPGPTFEFGTQLPALQSDLSLRCDTVRKRFEGPMFVLFVVGFGLGLYDLVRRGRRLAAAARAAAA